MAQHLGWGVTRPRGKTIGSWRGVLAGAAAALACAAPARAASTYTVTVTVPDLGIITSAASGDTVFRIDPTSGSVTRTSGTAVRATATTARAMVSIRCTGVTGDCGHNVNVQLGVVGSATGRARALARLTYVMGTATLTGAPPPPGSLGFTIAPVGLNATKTFFVGADFGVAGDDSGLPTGLAEADFFAWASEATPTSGGNGGYRATIIRGLSVSKTSDLVFGAVAKPPSGSGAVAIDPTNGARSTTGGVVAVGTPPPSRATFSVSGEGGQAISVTVPATFQMTGPQTITVTTSNSATGAPVLSGALGSAGSYAFGVGGSAPIDATTPSGDYSGSFTVTVAYN
jgi:hypothetical protein